MASYLKAVLSIAGSDPSGGAGIQADLKTMEALGVYGMSVITGLTAQNTRGVEDIFYLPDDFFERQLEAVLSDIRPEAVKIGMLGRASLIKITSMLLKKYKLKNIVLDPLMVSSSGKKLIEEDSLPAMEELFSSSNLITPNIPEAEFLTGMEISSLDQMIEASKWLSKKYETSVLVKGGHSEGSPIDVLYRDGAYKIFEGERIDNPNSHGTGCTLSSAIASFLALGEGLDQAVFNSKKYLEGALRDGLDLGSGPGPLNHMWKFYKGEDYERI